MRYFFNRYKSLRFLSLTIPIILVSCNKFVQIDPPSTQITASTVFSNNTSAASAMTGVYSNVLGSRTFFASGPYSISYLCGLSADELKNYSNNVVLSEYYSNSLNSIDDVYFWSDLYNKNYLSNSVVEGLAKSTGVSDHLKLQLTGEAKFMRAFLHFYLLNLFGDVPLVTTTDYRINNTISRTPKETVYNQIVQDLMDAKADLSDNFVDALGNNTNERVRPNKAAATALLARVYLYMGNWKNAESEATNVINNVSNYALTGDLDSTFLANNSEAIWQLQPIEPGFNTYDAYYFVLTSTPGTGLVLCAIGDNLLNSFELGDSRLAHWVGKFNDPISGKNYYYPYKYKINTDDPSQPVSEYVMVLRLAEQYLIRAEARTQQGNLTDAQADLNIIRSRAGLANTTANDQASLLTAILHERQVELFTEWGHRWFDLKRTLQINTVMTTVTSQKEGTWSPNWALFPIPLSELKANHNLLQNPGYN